MEERERWRGQGRSRTPRMGRAARPSDAGPEQGGRIPRSSRAEAPSDPFPGERGRASGLGHAGACSDPFPEERDQAPRVCRARASRTASDPGERSRALGLGRAGACSDLFPGEGGQVPGVGRTGAPSERATGLGRAGTSCDRASGVGRARALGVSCTGIPSGFFTGEGSVDSPPRPQLDVSSELFDPLLVLYSPRVPLPYPEARTFNNLAEYESFLRRGVGPRARGPGVSKNRKDRKTKKSPADPERLQRLKNLIVNVESGPQAPRRGHRGPKNVLTRMPLNEGSPLGELHRCVQDRVKVNVHIRTFKGLRGVCSGFLVAFDKFWNMALTDVDETYRKPVLGKAYAHEPQLTLTRLFDQLKLQESKATSELSAEPRDPKPSADSRSGSASGQHDTVRRSSRGKGDRREEEELPKASGRQAGGGESKSSMRVKGHTLPRPHRPRVDYQQVHSRHINQMFIRGENILLIHLAK